MVRELLVTIVALAAASAAWAGQDDRRLSGEVRYLPKIALPPAATITVQAQGAFGTRLSRTEFGADGRQVPLPFDLTVPADLSGTIAAVIRVEDRPRWIVQDVAFEAGNAPVDLGTLTLEPATPLAFATRYECGGTDVRFGVLDDRARLQVADETHDMAPAVSASGARYVAKSDDATEFWSKGGTAMLTVAGKKFPACERIDDTKAPYTAGGNEPGWHVRLGKSEVEVVADYGAVRRSAPRPDVQVENGSYVFEMPDIDARLTVEDTLCHDDATGMPHPHRATLELDDRSLRGCGGDPASLLTGHAWQIHQAAGGDIVDGSNPGITFDKAGRISGTPGCNRFMGGYEVTGEGLRIGPIGATMMACPDPLMQQERRMLDALEQVRRFDFDDNGALRLMGGPQDGPLLIARPR